MSIEMETMWDAMKQAHYKRTLEKLENGPMILKSRIFGTKPPLMR